MRPLPRFALVALTAAGGAGPGYRRPGLGMPAGWRRTAASQDSLRPFYDSLRTSRDTLLPPGADTARVPFAYDTAPAGASGDTAVALKWLDPVQDSGLRQLVGTALQDKPARRAARSAHARFPAP